MIAAATPFLDDDQPQRRFAVTPAAELLVLAVGIAIAAVSYFLLVRHGATERLLNPALISLLLVLNLVAGAALLMLLGRRVARRRAARSPVGGSGQLHVRLVALFSMAAAVPMVLVTIVASLLFQYGIQFWYSDQARGVVGNATQIARSSYAQVVERWRQISETAASDTATFLREESIYSEKISPFLLQQIYYRSLSDGVLFSPSPTSGYRKFAIINPDNIEIEREVSPQSLARVRAGQRAIVWVKRNRIQAVSLVPGTDNLYLFTAAATINMAPIWEQRQRGMLVERQYRQLIGQARSLQLRFNAALLAISLLIVGIAVWIGLTVADRLVRPVGELVGAARRVAGGDLTARVPDSRARDEVGTLSRAFNQMTARLQQQNAAVVAANDQLESRRALIEAVMAGVSAGVVATAPDRVSIMIANTPAQRLLGGEALVGRRLADVAPELDQLVRDNQRESIVQVAGVGGEARTLAVRIARGDAGAVLTFDDITQQQLDQRRAAWADVARRVAHEIKNPLTPIQLAAERLQRRYGGKVEAGDTVFARLTDTIVRQVGDLRRMVDEFSSFARMPKPVFRDEPLADLARQALFLHEVAHPGIRFVLGGAEPAPHLVCDRRQIGQALTNLVKNAVEAIEATGKGEGAVSITLGERDGRVCIDVADTGVGLPADRERLLEPYVTTRARGTGLGLAIVKKIVEEHLGTMQFSDRDGGGAQVTMQFDAAALAALDQGHDDEEPAGEGQLVTLTARRN